MSDSSSLPIERFGAELAGVAREEPSPLPRAVLYTLLVLFCCVVLWACFGKLDIVAVTSGKLVPQSFVKVVQPAEGGVVREILVAEGELVRAGQVLVRMDSKLSDADLTTAREELERKRLHLRRIDAELAGAQFRRQRDDPPALAGQVEAQMQARRRAYADALAAEQALRARNVHELESASEIEGKLRQVAPIYREQAAAWNQLAKEGYAGRLLALDRQRTSVEAEQELKAQERNVEALRAAIAQADRRIAQITSNYRQQLHEQREEIDSQYRRLVGDSAKHAHRNSLLELKAPQSGVVKDLATHTPGSVVAPGAVVLTLVPQGDPLVAEVWVTNADAGFVQPGNTVRIKVGAYPFQKYGLVNGVVEQIGADAQDGARLPDGTTKPAGELAFRARVRLDTQHLNSEGQALRLTSGMAVTAEVHVGSRTVLEYLLSPVRKVTAEAGRER